MCSGRGFSEIGGQQNYAFVAQSRSCLFTKRFLFPQTKPRPEHLRFPLTVECGVEPHRNEAPIAEREGLAPLAPLTSSLVGAEGFEPPLPGS